MHIRYSLLSVCRAQNSGCWWKSLESWGSIGYTAGGDIEDSSLAPGIQVVYEIESEKRNMGYFFEFGGGMFTDQKRWSDPGVNWRLHGQGFATYLAGDLELDVAFLNLAAGIYGSPAPRTRLYALGGFGYYMLDASAEIEALGSYPWTMDFVANMDVDIDNTFGFLLGAGVAYELAERWEAFVDYRFTMLTMEGEVSGNVRAFSGWYPYYARQIGEASLSREIKRDYNHGIFRVGVNYAF